MEITNFLLKLSVCINNIWILWIAVHWIQLIYPFILKQYFCHVTDYVVMWRYIFFRGTYLLLHCYDFIYFSISYHFFFFFFLMRNIIIAYNISQKIPCGKFYLSPNTHKKKRIVNWNGMQLNPGICISLLLFFHIHIHVSRSSLGHDLD